LQKVHARCAEALAASGAGHGIIGLHLAESGAVSLALPHLLKATSEMLQIGSARSAAVWLARVVNGADSLALPTEDPVRIEALCLEVRVLLHTRGAEAARDVAERAVELAFSSDRPDLAASATVAMSKVYSRQRQIQASLDIAAEGIRRFGDRFAPRDRAILDASCGFALALVGRADEAAVALNRALVPRGALPPSIEGDVHRHLGVGALAAGRIDSAEGHAMDALAAYTRGSSSMGRATVHNGLGNVARKRGDFAAARRHFGETLALMEALGHNEEVVPRLNLGITECEAGDWAEAEQHIVRAVGLARSTSHKMLEGAAFACLVAVAAGLGQWDAYDRRLAMAVSIFHEDGLREADVVMVSELAARLAAEQGHAARAAAARELADLHRGE